MSSACLYHLLLYATYYHFVIMEYTVQMLQPEHHWVDHAEEARTSWASGVACFAYPRFLIEAAQMACINRKVSILGTSQIIWKLL